MQLTVGLVVDLHDLRYSSKNVYNETGCAV